MANYDLNTLLSGIISKDAYSVTPFDSTDVFEFDITNNRSINLSLHNISSGDDADLRLYQDSNSNGIFDAGDQLVASSLNAGNANDTIDYQASTGTYFAQVSRYSYGSNGNVFYNLDLSATYDVGSLSSQIISRDNYTLSASDPTDVFEFNISNNRNISLYLHNISAGDDADLYLYQDSNGNGIFDSNDRQIDSALNGSNNNDSIDYQANAGTYFAEVSRYSYGSNGHVSYSLDLSATYDVGTLSTTPISRDGYGLSASDPTDIFEFDLTSAQAINLSLNNISSGDDADLYLYADTNGNGIFDTDDQQIASSINGGNNDDTISYQGNAGTYFAEVSRYGAGSSGSVSYDLDLSVGTAPPSVIPSTYQPFDASQVFALNSNADANHTVYLDFNGHTTTGTRWNREENNGADIITQAYDTDGNATTFSNTELEEIWEIWRRVSEDFMPFEVNVTTALPSLDQLSNTSASDTQWGIRTVIGGDGAWLGGGGGVAYVSSFNNSIDTPTFVFSENLNNSASSVAEAVSHEVGHTLGLTHDGTTLGVEYYAGHGSGPTGWAPIMGVGYYQALTQWSRGEYVNAENREDDLDIITGNNGFGYRADDYGDSLTNASTLSVNNGAAETYGIIETNTDTDWFSFSSSTGNINLDVNPFEVGANLDILAELRDAAGQVIQSVNALGSLAANVTANLNPGNYFLTVTGTGEGDLVSGYSDYGSIGQYSVTGSVA